MPICWIINKTVDKFYFIILKKQFNIIIHTMQKMDVVKELHSFFEVDASVST